MWNRTRKNPLGPHCEHMQNHLDIRAESKDKKLIDFVNEQSSVYNKIELPDKWFD